MQIYPGVFVTEKQLDAVKAFKKVQIYPGVSVTEKQLDAVKASLGEKETKRLEVVVRNLLLTLFSREQLSKSCCKSQRGKDDSREALP